MSIAVSAVIRPSRLLIGLTAGMCLIVLAVAFALGLGIVGRDIDSTTRVILASVCSFLSFFGFYHGSTLRKTIHIGISGIGHIRISDMTDKGACTEVLWPHLDGSEKVVRLQAGSTLWSRALLLRLQMEDGRVAVIPVLPDSVSPESFRALSVACRWVANHTDPGDRIF